MAASDNFFSSNKITPYHLSRLACVYVRQSSPKQVKHNRESQAYQYRLAQRAADLGWEKARIRVIDADLGRSGREAERQDGFQEMLADISRGGVGIILSYEVSRLSRRSSDWYALTDLASMFETLIADADGVYDPRLYNDRLLLGLKGTMSEAELHQMKLRLHEGRLNRVKRGGYRQRLPTGLVRRPDGAVVKHPDKEVRRTLLLVFKKFEELKSCGRLVTYLCGRNVLLPRQQMSGLHRGSLRWKRPSRTAVRDIIGNPAYAGAFVHGRRQCRAAGPDHGLPSVSRRPQAEWIHVEQGVYPAYISWGQFQANQSQLARNGTSWDDRIQQAQGAVRNGPALLAGLVVCGSCGGRMKVNYNDKAWYFCCAPAREYRVGYCPTIPADAADEAVTRAFMDAVRPAQLDALQALLAEKTAEQSRLDEHWRARIRRARGAAPRSPSGSTAWWIRATGWWRPSWSGGGKRDCAS